MKNRVSMFLMLLMVAGVSQAELKIGYVNMAKVMEKSPQAAKAKSRLEAEFSPRGKAFESQLKEIKSLEEKLSKDGQIMSESEQRKLEKDILDKKRDANRVQQEMAEDADLRRREEMIKMNKAIFEAVKTVAKEESFDLLLSDPLYASEQLDATSRILQKMETLQ